MFVIFKDKLDKKTSLICFLVISLVTLSLASSGALNLFNIAGVFKQ